MGPQILGLAFLKIKEAVSEKVGNGLFLQAGGNPPKA
jgi:hypothetical protein